LQQSACRSTPRRRNLASVPKVNVRDYFRICSSPDPGRRTFLVRYSGGCHTGGRTAGGGGAA
jgi:hypothetical protein